MISPPVLLELSITVLFTLKLLLNGRINVDFIRNMNCRVIA